MVYFSIDIIEVIVVFLSSGRKGLATRFQIGAASCQTERSFVFMIGRLSKCSLLVSRPTLIVP